MTFVSPVVPVAAPSIPVEWITSGVVTPVNSPAAAVPTAYVSQPVVVAPAAADVATIRDAVVSSMAATAPASMPQQQLAMTVPAPIAMAAAATAPLAQLQVASPPTQAGVPAAGAAAAPAPTVSSTVAAIATPVGDPTLVSSVAGAVAGFASATGRVVSGAADSVATAAGAGVSKARQVGSELWAGIRSPRAVHVTQVPSKFNPSPAAGNRDCGPASVVMALRLLGKKIPGIATNAAPQKLINRIRQLAGNSSNTMSTTNHELERALSAAGTATREIADAASIKAAVLAGKPVILNGNPRHPGAYGFSFSAKQMTPYDGAHWIVVSGFDKASGKFIINDPLSKAGAVKVTPKQLEAYRGGSLGIEVTG